MKEKFLNKKRKVLAMGGVVTCFLWTGLFFPRIYISNTENTALVNQYAMNGEVVSENEEVIRLNTEADFIYLSDLDYLTTSGMSQNGWGGHEIQKDKNQEGGILSLIVNGEKRSYAKGMSIHARGWATYDIEELSTNYSRFIAKLGVDASRGTNGSLFYRIYASHDATTWDILLQTPVLTGTSEAIDVDLSVAGYKYLRIYVDANGSNAADHGTIANAKLVTPDYVENDVFYEGIHRVEYYDELLKEHDTEYNYTNNYKLILERELVNKLGFWNIQYSSETNANFLDTMEWILGNNRVLEEVIEVGEIANQTTFIKVLADLYHEYEDELKTENGYIYEKMMIALAAAYSTDKVISPLSFSFLTPTYDYMSHFALYKQLFDDNKLTRMKTNTLAGELVPNEWFKDYHVELMRMVMQDATSDIDLIWLNGYTTDKQSLSFYMIPYYSPNYNQSKLYDEANRELYDNKYFLSKYSVPYGNRVQRYWMVIEAGGICWNASRFGQSMNRVHGIPATGAYQPGHELYIHYYQDENGNGYWTPEYGNWGSAGSTWGGANPYRYLFNWNNKYFTDRHISGSKGASSTGYLYLGQDNLNHYDEYKQSVYYNLTANSYTSNEQKLETYFKSLEVNELNLDTYDHIITLYKQMSVQNEGGTITSHDWYTLANKIIDAYAYHPVAMFDLLKVIRPYLEGSERLHIDRLEKETLTQATTATANDTLHGDGVRTHARQLLNKAQPDPMTFSFDGEDAGKIVKNPMYSLAWGYSLDGGATFTEYKIDDSITLTPAELASITAENDIIINFMGLSYTFRIDITEGTLSDLLFANDLENRVVGIDLTYEWRNSESDPWTSYKTASPDNTGDKTLYVRRGATGTQLASSSAMYTFTADNQPNTRKYVPVSHLSIESVSTEATSNSGAAIYAIDGNYNTRYHSAWNGTDTERFITIKLDKPRYISAVEFVPAGGGNGRIVDGTIWGSTDGEHWEILSQKTGIIYPSQANTIEQAKAYTQNFEIANPKEVQYIKIVADRTNGNWFSARAFNLYQDLTSNERPTAGIGYSTTEPTRENVVARLVNISADNYEITSPGGDTHIFTEEGDHSFTFTFIDKDTGLEGSAVARVDWIDRTAPTATIAFSPSTPTNQSVVATLKPSEEITVTNNSKGGYSADEEGNVYNIDGILVPGFTADSDGNVWDTDGNYITNINPFIHEFLSNGEFTFEFVDRAGNKGTVTANVDWIDMEAPKATITYDITSSTSKNVVASITFDKENVTVINNNHSTEYTFTENGEFTFEYQDLAGNKGVITAKVDWIIKEDEPNTDDTDNDNNNDNDNNDNNDNNTPTNPDNNNNSNGNGNTNTGGNNSSGDKWTSTNISRPSTNNKLPSISVDKNDTSDGDTTNGNENNSDNNETDDNNYQEPDHTKEENDAKNDDAIIEEGTEKHNSNKIAAFIGVCSFIILIALARLLKKMKKERI